MDLIYNKQNQIETTPVWLSPMEVFEYLQGNAALVDIRPEYETNYRIFDVPKVLYLPYSSYRQNFNMIPRDIPLVIADNVGLRSEEVACFLIEQGYTQVACLAGGVIEWDHRGLPLTKDMDCELTGGCACRLRSKKNQIGGSSVTTK
jgi:rhodanese-related sulfurtransferase